MKEAVNDDKLSEHHSENEDDPDHVSPWLRALDERKARDMHSRENKDGVDNGHESLVRSGYFHHI